MVVLLARNQRERRVAQWCVLNFSLVVATLQSAIIDAAAAPADKSFNGLSFTAAVLSASARGGSGPLRWGTMTVKRKNSSTLVTTVESSIIIDAFGLRAMAPAWFFNVASKRITSRLCKRPRCGCLHSNDDPSCNLPCERLRVLPSLLLFVVPILAFCKLTRKGLAHCVPSTPTRGRVAPERPDSWGKRSNRPSSPRVHPTLDPPLPT